MEESLLTAAARSPVRSEDVAIVEEDEEMQLARYGTVSPIPTVPPSVVNSHSSIATSYRTRLNQWGHLTIAHSYHNQLNQYDTIDCL